MNRFAAGIKGGVIDKGIETDGLDKLVRLLKIKEYRIQNGDQTPSIQRHVKLCLCYDYDLKASLASIDPNKLAFRHQRPANLPCELPDYKTKLPTAAELRNWI